jgi:hypothetical protein
MVEILLITLVNLAILGLNLKLYTEILKAKHIESRKP